MAIRYIFFDLDGTLLPMDQDTFIQAYFGTLSEYMALFFDFEPEKLIKTIWKGTAAMLQNDGSVTNECAFWKVLSSIYGESIRNYAPVFDKFYTTKFRQVRNACGFDPRAAQVVHRLQDMGYQTVLATNPIFPAAATRERIQWAGLQPEDFLLYTTYENSTYCKPNPAYYRSILDKLGIAPEECLMVGNDASEDLAAQKLGIKVYLLTDCLINKEGLDLSAYPHGNLDTLMDYIQSM